jgi:hypothetical protein
MAIIFSPSRLFYLRDSIQKIPDWRVIYTAVVVAQRMSQQAKLWITGSTEKFFGDCVKTCEDVAPYFDENRAGCFTMTTPRLTLPSSPSNFWRNKKMAVVPHPPYSPDLAPCDFCLFPKMNLKLNGRRFDHMKCRSLRRECLTLWQKRTSRKRSKNGDDGGTGFYMWEGTTLRVMVADMLYGDFYYFYSVRPEYFR